MKYCYIFLVYHLPTKITFISPHFIAEVNFYCTKTQEAKCINYFLKWVLQAEFLKQASNKPKNPMLQIKPTTWIVTNVSSAEVSRTSPDTRLRQGALVRRNAEFYGGIATKKYLTH